MQRILLVDDSPDIHLLVKAALKDDRLEVISAYSVDEGFNLFSSQSFQLILLDIGLPSGDGFELLTRLTPLAKFKGIPVFFLTGESEITAKVTAFELGAEDYIVKPFDITEFRARVQARLKKLKAAESAGAILSKGPFEMDLSLQKAYLAEPVRTDLNLTPIEFKLLVLFCRNEGVALSRELILTTIWGKEVHVFDRTVDTHVSSLRKKLQSHSRSVQSVPGVGYILKLP